MADEAKISEEKKSEEKSEESKPFLEWNGRSFKTQDEAKGFLDALAYSQGNAAQKKDAAERELAPFQKYNLKKPTVDEAGLLKEVDTLLAEDKQKEAYGLMFEYARSAKAEAAVIHEENKLWLDYKARNPDVFKALPEDMARDYVFNNYRDELYDTEDPFGLIDRILKPKAARLQETPQVETPAATLGAGQATPAVDSKEKDSKEPEETGAWDKMLDGFDFK